MHCMGVVNALLSELTKRLKQLRRKTAIISDSFDPLFRGVVRECEAPLNSDYSGICCAYKGPLHCCLV